MPILILDSISPILLPSPELSSAGDSNVIDAVALKSFLIGWSISKPDLHKKTYQCGSSIVVALKSYTIPTESLYTTGGFSLAHRVLLLMEPSGLCNLAIMNIWKNTYYLVNPQALFSIIYAPSNSIVFLNFFIIINISKYNNTDLPTKQR